MIEKHLVWDAHACLPLLHDTDVTALLQHRDAGVDVVSVNVGMDFNPVADILRIIACFRNVIERRNQDFLFAESLADVDRAQATGRLAVSFDLEGSMMLQDRPESVDSFYRLGVRQIHLAYNRNNSVAGGCHDKDSGLTPLGREVVSAINDAGMIMDCSHMGERSALDVMACSTKPVSFSHTNAAGIFSFGRCISDDLMQASARTGGVIGISGVNRFYGQALVTPALLVDQIDYVVDRVGIEHVGIGLDYMYPSEVDDNPPGLDRGYWWPKSAGYFSGLQAIDVLHPSQLGQVVGEMVARGYTAEAISAVMGGNFYRMAQQSWC
ncbi:dipeptidase [Reinekea blandensis]|uniref:Uncharacterized protein n=1 Tax=Reinekea blandensis MED297 TaxID=314283 RepID=A4BCV2_9GAMM|nr:membrane dipeptidase [Reinekea blandensis]EAR10034.1 hypothetical protein MED297_08096 [Reinekea sp. MED297] [Reinekea blandensis MED297]